MERDVLELYDVPSTASYVVSQGFSIVALQFPDELLKDSVAVTIALQKELSRVSENGHHVKLFVMADTTYGSCCADEVAAAHVNAECIIHYGHACHSPTSRLPVFYVYGKGEVDVEHCGSIFWSQMASRGRVLVLFGLEYAHAMPYLKEKLLQNHGVDHLEVQFAEVLCREAKPGNILSGSCDTARQGELSGEDESGNGLLHDVERTSSAGRASTVPEVEKGSKVHRLGGLNWCIGEDRAMEDFTILWIGDEGPALTNVMLTYNGCSVLRYDPAQKLLHTDVASQSRALKRRYYLVERAKDANIVGIVVGTLGVAGYEEAIQHLRDIINAVDKKSYVLLMGKPNPAKLANFPECEVFVHVACPQTALLDSKEYLAPLITPYEAQLAFLRGSEWTGAYRLDFQSIVPEQSAPTAEEGPRFSLVQGHYVGEDPNHTSPAADGEDRSSRALVLAKAAEHALQLSSTSDPKPIIKSSAEYLAVRSYQGLEVHRKGESPDPPAGVVMGRKGRAAGYSEEAS